jgi:hypothetical protein
MSRRCAMVLGGRWDSETWMRDAQDGGAYSDMASVLFWLYGST